MADLMRERGAVVRAAAQALEQGGMKLELIPSLILRIINERMWEQRAIPEENWGLSPQFNSFEEFVTTGPWEGLGTTVTAIMDVCRRNTEAVEAITHATQRDRGRPTVNGNNVPIFGRPEGNAQAKALRRLRSDRPDLLQRVLDGELSAHAAMVEAGFRRRMITINSDVERAARDLCRHFRDRADRERLAALITEAQA
jgi:hypothetical protein